MYIMKVAIALLMICCFTMAQHTQCKCSDYTTSKALCPCSLTQTLTKTREPEVKIIDQVERDLFKTKQLIGGLPVQIYDAPIMEHILKIADIRFILMQIYDKEKQYYQSHSESADPAYKDLLAKFEDVFNKKFMMQLMQLPFFDYDNYQEVLTVLKNFMKILWNTEVELAYLGSNTKLNEFPEPEEQIDVIT